MKNDLKTAIHELLNVLTIPADAPPAVHQAEKHVRELLYGPPSSG